MTGKSTGYVDVVTLGAVCADVMTRPVDRVPPVGQLTLVPEIELHLGGLAGATAVVLARLGLKVAFIGKVGQDGFGDFIVDVLKTEGVNVDKVARCTKSGTSATVVLINEQGERSFLHQIGANAELGESDFDYDFLDTVKVLHWGGPAITPGLDGEPIGHIMRKARAMGVKTSMDTCFDGQGNWFANIEHALPHLDIVMSSLDEARHYTGQDTPEAIADFYLSYGAEVAMVKLGGDGLFLKTAGKTLRLDAHAVPVVDTTGAGDAACAGFLYGVVQDWELESCAKLANAVGALTVQKMGGTEGVRSLDDALAFAGLS